jgi:hypothetical protein
MIFSWDDFLVEVRGRENDADISAVRLHFGTAQFSSLW